MHENPRCEDTDFLRTFGTVPSDITEAEIWHQQLNKMCRNGAQRIMQAGVHGRFLQLESFYKIGGNSQSSMCLEVRICLYILVYLS